jgi:hypothetical protein
MAMSWESRKGKGRYYTRSRRVNGKIRREYIGTGRHAEVIAEIDAAERAERELERKLEKEQRECDLELDAEVDELCQLIDGLARGALLAAGFHSHRGTWRRRYGKNK